MTTRQETIDRYRHFRAIAKQHLGGALKHLSRTAIKEAAQRLGLWSRGKLVLDSPDEMDLVRNAAAREIAGLYRRRLEAILRLIPRPTETRRAILAQEVSR